MGLVGHADQYQKVADQEGGRTRYADGAPDPTTSRAQNAQICTVVILIIIKAELIQIGGSARVIPGKIPITQRKEKCPPPGEPGARERRLSTSSGGA